MLADHRFLAFSLGEEAYAVPLAKVREVIALGEITPIPHTPVHLKGVMNLRGQVISIVDLRTRLRMKPAEKSSETAVIILDLHPQSLGMIVDSVNSVLALGSDKISPPPDVEGSLQADFIQGVARIDSGLVLIMDIEKGLL
ncbi:MAG: purine-binding chemotaxis protein CheW [Proteobacteria bacterium]|nr:MAG: purine-binding chemotaxis protein CheW [Pseudomonadota bacterium]